MLSPALLSFIFFLFACLACCVLVNAAADRSHAAVPIAQPCQPEDILRNISRYSSRCGWRVLHGSVADFFSLGPQQQPSELGAASFAFVHGPARHYDMKRSKGNAKCPATLALDVSAALKLKQELGSGQDLQQQELLHVLQADKACDSGCKGKKDNPSCLHGFLPAVGSVRRKGLWQKEPQGLMHLGANPAGLRRQVNTCSVTVASAAVLQDISAAHC